ncbi:two-component system, sensor histidine kinase YesM [Gracilibacillus orientalis]|uniref:histidine kinase n=1 Tax=Gracilibacillus orientalis TaxID=334253 RepID=A0A1I4N844_9BACI|nr:sensor histidine kinase [Gracilibacillus orientalis]SFM11565.1 two-component system, sensor histidine kinase YesM [Gracilibacillus orientalis]
MNIKRFYNTLSIKKKLISILLVFVISVSTISFSAIQVVYHIYDKQLLNNTSKMLNVYTTALENELRKVEKHTFSFLMEGSTQDNLQQMNTDSSSYERYVATNEMRSKLLSLSQAEPYISSVSYLNTKGVEYTVGNSVTVFKGNYLEMVMNKLDNTQGEISWFKPMEGDSSFLVARKLRSVEQLKPIGYILIRIDPERLVRWVSSTWPDARGELLIFNENNQKIYKDPLLPEQQFSPDDLVGSYDIRNIEGNKYLITKGYSGYTSWSYYTVVPYESIFNSISITRLILLLTFIVLMFILCVVGMKLSNHITAPIIKLSNRMKKIDKKEFEITEFPLEKQPDGDEVAKLNNDFVFMVNKIRTLIKENYIKQLLIKEAELKALQAQINPHFLYNTLNFINWEAKLSKQHKIATMVKALGAMLRSATKNSNHVTTIGEELKLVDAYITILKYRYEGRLEFDCECPEHLKDKYIIKMCLQPIVENSIKYGLEQKAGTCRINIKIESKEDFIEIIISDNGPGLSKSELEKVQTDGQSSSSTGIGLKNIDKRMKLSFGNQYGLTVHSKEPIGTSVALKIPLKEVSDNHEV